MLGTTVGSLPPAGAGHVRARVTPHELRTFGRPSGWRAARDLGFVWLQIVVATALYVLYPAWWTFVVLAIVILIDAGRTVVSLRSAQRFGSAALQANAIHLGGDLLGSAAVLAGLAAAAGGYPNGD